ncbi:MAG: type II toxin-antitoxin system RelE/ParE family toxin [Bacteroidota bacterium]
MAESYQVVLTKEAKKDINDILTYLQKQVSHQEAVDGRQKIIEAIHSLSNMPSSRSPVQEAVQITKEIVYRQIIAKQVYRIINRIKEIQKVL